MKDAAVPGSPPASGRFAKFRPVILVKEGHIVSVDVDASGSELNVRNRLKMLLDC